MSQEARIKPFGNLDHPWSQFETFIHKLHLCGNPFLRMASLPLMYGIVSLLVLYLINKLVFTRKKLPLPPGPKGLPIIGNVGDLPPKGGLEWQHWLKHKDLYGPLSSVTVFGQTIILIHDLETALELLDKRGAKYSSRPRMVFAGEMCVLHMSEITMLSFANDLVQVWLQRANAFPTI